jgi:hypothetical protein
MAERCRVALLIPWIWLAAGAVSADVVVIANRAPERVVFAIQVEGQPDQNFSLPSGEIVSIRLSGEGLLRFVSAHQRTEYLLDPDSAYFFYRRPEGEDGADPGPALRLQQIGLVDAAEPFEERPAGRGQSSGPAPVRGGDGILRIPVKLLVDDDERAAVQRWKQRLGKRLEAASLVFERYCRVGFEAVALETWDSNDELDVFEKSFVEFESRVRTEPARLAIGFTSQYQVPVGRTNLGGTRGPLGTHILIGEWSQSISEAERLELLVHELGHYLGAAHSPERQSVMRPLLTDRLPGTVGERLVLDPLNALAVCLVGEEMGERRLESLDGMSVPRRKRLTEIYATLSRALPDDPAAPRLSAVVAALREKGGSGEGEQGPEEEVGKKPAGTLEEARQAVVAAILAAARDNAGKQAAKNGQGKPRLEGDHLTELYVKAAAAAAAGMDEAHREKAFLLALATALDRSDLIGKYSTAWNLGRRGESDVERKERLAVIGRPAMRGREDLAAHFGVSAALTVLTGPPWAESLGVGKELRDAKTESGFSFSDLCANLAGIRFAQRVRAGELPLAELVGGFRVDAHFPDVSGLPDGLSEEDFRSRYGSIGDGRFTEMLGEIRGRIAELEEGGR